MRSNGEPLEWPPCIIARLCAAGSRPRFAGYLPYTGTSSVRVLQDPREEGFFELPPLTSLDSSGEGLSTTDAADPSVLTDPSTVKTNLIPERIEKTYSVSSQMMTSTNSGPETVVFPNVVGGGVMSQNPLLEGLKRLWMGLWVTCFLHPARPPSGIYCRIFHHPPTDHQPHYPMEEAATTRLLLSQCHKGHLRLPRRPHDEARIFRKS